MSLDRKFERQSYSGRYVCVYMYVDLYV